MSDEDVKFADWISDLNDLYDSASEAEILAKVKEFRASVAHELAEQIRAWGQDGEARKRGDEPSPFYMWEDADRAADLIDPEATLHLDSFDAKR